MCKKPEKYSAKVIEIDKIKYLNIEGWNIENYL
jgi:hypothetical protein